MSEHYGYLNMGVYKKDGTPDAAKAKEVFDWITANFEWSKYDDEPVFALDGHRITESREGAFIDGIPMKEAEVPESLHWGTKVFNAVKPEKIAATFLYDGSETSWHNNFFSAALWEEGKSSFIFDQAKVPKDSNTGEFPDYVEGFSIDELAQKGEWHRAESGDGWAGKDYLGGRIPENKATYTDEYGNIVSEEEDSSTTYYLWGCEGLDFEIVFTEWDGTGECSDGYLITEYELTRYEYDEEWTADWGTFLFLDKDGNPMRALKDFDHFKGDDMWVRVPRSDFEQEKLKEGKYVFTEEGLKRWRERTGIEEKDGFVIQKGILKRVTDKTIATAVIPEGVKKIRYAAFENCASLASVTISEGVTEIGGSAFRDCALLASVTIPEDVTVIGWGAFYDCTSLKEITFGGTMEQWNAVKKDDCRNNSVPAKSVKCSDGEAAL